MSKFVCVDSANRFYLPVESITSFAKGGLLAVGEEPPKTGVVVNYWEGDQIKRYLVELSEWSVDQYCKSLQTHINLLK